MLRLPMSPVCVLTTAAACSLVAGHAQAESTDFDTTLTALSGSSFQVDNTFSLLFDLNTVHLDLDNDNVPDQDVAFGAGDYLGAYNDPEHYILDFALPGSGTDLKPMFMGSELSAAASVDWRLSYASTPGDGSSIYSTIMSGSADYIGGGLILNIDGGYEWPVNGWTVPDVGIPLGTHWAADLADFSSFTFTYPGAGGPAGLVANVIPAPGVLALLGLGGIAARRRRD